MKYVFHALGIVALSCLPSLSQVTEIEREVTKNGDVTTTKVVTFDSGTKTQVVRYFDTYKQQRFGLPPEWVTTMRVNEMPTEWQTVRIVPGSVIALNHRAFLYAAPDDLVRVLPTAPAGVRYFVAGGNVIAVDGNYRVVDSLQIPSIRISVE